MCELDLEDTNFLEDLSEELRRHDGVYEAEAVELDNIIFRAKQVETGCTNTNCKGYKFKDLKSHKR